MKLPPAAQITIFTGRFGSGKTETSLNYASYLAAQARLAGQTAAPLLIDLDLATPYFRTRDKAEEMAQRGVKVIAPFPVGRHIHVPAVSPQILGAIEQASRRPARRPSSDVRPAVGTAWDRTDAPCRPQVGRASECVRRSGCTVSPPVVIDLGGDRQGARALAPYAASIGTSTSADRRRIGMRSHNAPHIPPFAMLFVLNPYRPDPATGQPLDTIDGIRAAILEIESSARLKVTALVSNPHLLDESTPERTIAGHHAVQQASKSLRLPIAFGIVSESLYKQPCFNQRLVDQLPLLVIHRFFQHM